MICSMRSSRRARTPINPRRHPVTIDRQKLREEIGVIQRLATWARAIGIDTKTRAFLKALEIGFEQMVTTGAARKALIFTESRRTQEYLKAFLESHGYQEQVVLFNGTNGGREATAIYERWADENRDTGRASGSRAVDVRTALIEHFRDEATILLATEAAAEGINLQFCSLVVNYDLPWNPQRIEQRIGRCHRYGQKHDVVVINFLNERNDADRRVLELLTEKFSLFNGVFGASDEVLGSIESGVDFEKRILAIYQECRTPEEIDAAFRTLQAEMDEQIRTRLDDTRRLRSLSTSTRTCTSGSASSLPTPRHSSTAWAGDSGRSRTSCSMAGRGSTTRRWPSTWSTHPVPRSSRGDTI